MLVTLLGLALVAAAAVFISWPLLRDSAGGVRPDEEERPPASPRHTHERDKNEALAAIKEAEFDHRLGKLSDDDYRALRTHLEERALEAMAAIDQASAAGTHAPSLPEPLPSGGREAPPRERALRAVTGAGAASGASSFCSGCGHHMKRSVQFCPSCGRKQTKAARGRKRA